MNKILITSSLFLVIISISMIGYKIVSATVMVEEIKDEMMEQQKKEDYLTPYGYTLDNPNIILDPYGVSPLTALILFETEKPTEVTVTVIGKDENSTYTNTFKKNTKHYLPIYGLYPDTTNTVELKINDIIKTYTIKTSSLPNDLIFKQIENNTNNLYFITSDSYPYALDNNNEVRWYLTKNYSGKISRLETGNLLLGSDTLNLDNNPTSLLEIDLLGKIYKQYNLEKGYYKTYVETPTSIIILSKNVIELDKFTGTLLNNIELSMEYSNIDWQEETNEVILTTSTQTTTLNLETKQQITETNLDNILVDSKETLLPLYINDENYKLTKGIKINLNEETNESSQNIFLINYKKIDKRYEEYNISINKTEENLQITGEFKQNDEVYLILDKFLNKKVYDLKNNYTVINKEGLSGKYSIYLKINDTIYKTNNYVYF